MKKHKPTVDRIQRIFDKNPLYGNTYANSTTSQLEQELDFMVMDNEFLCDSVIWLIMDYLEDFDYENQ